MSGQPLPDAVVFDCDGTLVDSERVSSDAMRAALAELGHELTDGDLATMTGRAWSHNRSHLVARFGLSDADVERYVERFGALAIPRFEDDDLVFDDAVDVLGELRAAGVPLAVCTSSSRAHLDRVLSLAPLRGVFDVAVAREDTDRHKPDPMPYLVTVERLGVAVRRPLPPVDVAAVEDSAPGVAAAVAAGCWTVAVDRGAGVHDLSRADVVVERIGLADLVPSRGA